MFCLLISKIEQLHVVNRYEYGLFTAASTLVVRVRSVYAAHWYYWNLLKFITSYRGWKFALKIPKLQEGFVHSLNP